MRQDIKKLDSICRNLADIEIGLMNGEIEFVYDNLSSAMKAGHPSEIMDGILSTIYYPTIQGRELPLERLRSTLRELKEFAERFQIKEMDEPLKELAAYIRQSS